jgi:hypothetical protein
LAITHKKKLPLKKKEKEKENTGTWGVKGGNWVRSLWTPVR